MTITYQQVQVISSNEFGNDPIRQQATRLFRKQGGMLRLGVRPRTLYVLRDAGILAKLNRGLYRLDDSHHSHSMTPYEPRRSGRRSMDGSAQAKRDAPAPRSGGRAYRDPKREPLLAESSGQLGSKEGTREQTPVQETT